MVLARVVQVHRADLAALDDVAVHVVTAAALVQIDAPGENEELAVIVEADAVGAVVIADRLPAAAPAAGIGATGVLHLQVAVANAVVLQRVERTAVKNAAARHVVDQVMRDTDADPAEHHADPVPVELADMVDVAVDDLVPAPLQLLLVAAVHRDAVPADVPDVAAAHRAGTPFVDRHRRTVEVAQIVDQARLDDGLFAFCEAQRVLLGAAQLKPADARMMRLMEGQDVVDGRHSHRVAGEIRARRRDQIEFLVRAVLPPLAGRVQLLTQPHQAEAVLGARGVGHLVLQRKGACRRLIRLDPLDAVPPVVAREDANLALLRVRPRARVARPQHHRVGAFALDVLIHRRALAVDIRPAA
ncbi:MAG: hypothetical protein BWX70_03113 [Verrucomicrobia bacterium ADurb.Bin070]|nr:MAG: hypothetical protein BWX70_03113 [Verrucomicrobia bacterium ADurb.Bin070]